MELLLRPGWAVQGRAAAQAHLWLGAARAHRRRRRRRPRARGCRALERARAHQRPGGRPRTAGRVGQGIAPLAGRPGGRTQRPCGRLAALAAITRPLGRRGRTLGADDGPPCRRGLSEPRRAFRPCPRPYGGGEGAEARPSARALRGCATRSGDRMCRACHRAACRALERAAGSLCGPRRGRQVTSCHARGCDGRPAVTDGQQS